jgi:hypothetical protein
MKALADTKSKRWLHTIDPYGDKPYFAGPSILGAGMGYNDNSYSKTQVELWKLALEKEVNYCHWKQTSLDWIKTFPQTTFWAEGRGIDASKMKFSVAYLDGDHAWSPVKEEFDFFYERMPTGGLIVIDDFNYLGGESEVLQRFANYLGEWYFNYDDSHYRCYFTKA